MRFFFGFSFCFSSSFFFFPNSQLSPFIPTKTRTHQQQDFPYNFEAGIEHSNVWSFSPLLPQQLEALIEERRPAKDFETAWYVNPAALASIPDVWHAHVLSRRRKERSLGREEKEKDEETE